jgi:hypothetical protein
MIPPAIFLHSSVPAVLRAPELLHAPPTTSVATVVVVLGVTGGKVSGVAVVVVVVIAGNVTGVVVVEELGEHDFLPAVAFFFHDVAVFNKEVFFLPLALAAARVKFFDCCVCETKYFDL